MRTSTGSIDSTIGVPYLDALNEGALVVTQGISLTDLDTAPMAESTVYVVIKEDRRAGTITIADLGGTRGCWTVPRPNVYELNTYGIDLSGVINSLSGTRPRGN